jgi:hypothetical protein
MKFNNKIKNLNSLLFNSNNNINNNNKRKINDEYFEYKNLNKIKI